MENLPNFRQSFDFWKILEMTIKVKGTIVDIPLFHWIAYHYTLVFPESTKACEFL
jgi:hypothetical protein